MTEVRPGYISDGNGNWIQIGPSIPVGSTVYYQASEPATPQTGDIWIDSDNEVPSIDNSQFLRWRKTVSGGETSLSGLDDSGLSLQYTPAYEQVYLNGVLLVRGADYTATTGTSITGLTTLAASDVVEVFSVVARVVGDVYTQSQTNSLLDAKSNVSSTGLVLLNTTTLTGTSANVNILNVFSSSYKNYKVMLNLSTSSADNPHIRFGVSGTPDSTSGNYRHAGFYSYYGYSGTGTFYSGGSGTGINVGAISTAGQLYGASLDIYNPNEEQYTNLTGLYHDNGGYSYYTGGIARTTTQYTDLYIYTSNNMTGTIKIYGYK